MSSGILITLLLNRTSVFAAPSQSGAPLICTSQLLQESPLRLSSPSFTLFLPLLFRGFVVGNSTHDAVESCETRHFGWQLGHCQVSNLPGPPSSTELFLLPKSSNQLTSAIEPQFLRPPDMPPYVKLRVRCLGYPKS